MRRGFFLPVLIALTISAAFANTTSTNEPRRDEREAPASEAHTDRVDRAETIAVERTATPPLSEVARARKAQVLNVAYPDGQGLPTSAVYSSDMSSISSRPAAARRRAVTEEPATDEATVLSGGRLDSAEAVEAHQERTQEDVALAFPADEDPNDPLLIGR